MRFKNIICIIFACFCVVTVIHAKASSKDLAKGLAKDLAKDLAEDLTNNIQTEQQPNISRARIGVQIGTGILSGSIKVGLFGE